LRERCGLCRFAHSRGPVSVPLPRERGRPRHLNPNCPRTSSPLYSTWPAPRGESRLPRVYAVTGGTVSVREVRKSAVDGSGREEVELFQMGSSSHRAENQAGNSGVQCAISFALPRCNNRSRPGKPWQSGLYESFPVVFAFTIPFTIPQILEKRIPRRNIQAREWKFTDNLFTQNFRRKRWL